MEAIEIRGLTFTYPGQAEPALKGVTAIVHAGEFVTLCGLSGSGKTTLLRQLKPVLAPHGNRTGEILFEGKPLDTLGLREQSAKIGFVQQSPENQLVTDKVWHELAFGLESLGYDTPVIRGRVAEMATFFGIEDWFCRDVTELSGGQKQLLNLASVMVLQPSVLLLDEPTSQLDPIAAGDFLAAVGKINRELGTTILITEQRLEEVFPLSGQVLVLDGGCVIADGTPREVGGQLRAAGHPLFFAMPTAMRVWAAVPNDAACPVTVRDGRDWLGAFAAEQLLTEIPADQPPQSSGDTAISLSEVWFRYEKGLPDVLKGLSLTVQKGEFFALLGGNGTGKTTALSVIAGLQSPYRGEARVRGTVGVLPQDPQALLVKKTVREELREVMRGKQPAEAEAGVARAAALCRLEGLLDRHPYDLSGGEQQRAALAEILLRDPDILLLDEPTKGLDAQFKRQLAALLQTLCRRGVTVFMVSHDVEFCAEYAHHCALFFDGSIVTDGPPRRFFSGNSFYTTAANRMARNLLPTAITAYDLIVACGGTVSATPEMPVETMSPSAENEAETQPPKLPRWRKWISVVAGAAAIWAFIKAVNVTDLTSLVDASGVTGPIGDYLSIYTVLLGALLILALTLGRRSPAKVLPVRYRRPPSRRTVAAVVAILLFIPLTLFFGTYFLGGRKYYFIALLLLAEILLLFFLAFEGRRPQARELTVVAVLCALGIAGRAAFFMLPEFKPVAALVILSGVAFGGETGFLVGAVTMLTSNVLFGQGPWTPWQMVAMGLIGFLAGVLFGKGRLHPTRSALCVFGAISCVVVYGGIMNPAAALIWTQTLNRNILLTYYISGLPWDLVRAAATVFFLWFTANPLLEKLERIKVKYGMLE